MEKIFKKHFKCWLDKHFTYSTIFGILLFAVSLYLNQLAAGYALRSASSPVKDIVLDNTPIFNVNFIVSTGAFLFFLFTTTMALLDPRKLPFLLKSAAIFVIVRSAFITFTHLGPVPHSYIDQSDFFSSYNTGADYFFSGHTGLPFLVALVFWDDKTIRYISITASLILGISVLLGHLHYSIDVFAAFFITYSIFALTQKLFPKDYQNSVN